MLKLVECGINLRRATSAYSVLCFVASIIYSNTRDTALRMFTSLSSFLTIMILHSSVAYKIEHFFSRCHVSLVFYIYRGQSISFQQSLSVFCINIHKLDGENTISPMKFSFFLMDLKQTQLSLFSYHGLHDRLGYQNFSTNALVPVVSRSYIP